MIAHPSIPMPRTRSGMALTRRPVAPAASRAAAGLLLGITMLAGVTLPPDRALAQRGDPPPVHGKFYGDSVYTVLPPGTIPAITQPAFLAGDEAAGQMRPDEPVLGVVLEGDARAYSLWQLDAHEIVNDTVGGVPLAATW